MLSTCIIISNWRQIIGDMHVDVMISIYCLAIQKCISGVWMPTPKLYWGLVTYNYSLFRFCKYLNQKTLFFSNFYFRFAVILFNKERCQYIAIFLCALDWLLQVIVSVIQWCHLYKPMAWLILDGLYVIKDRRKLLKGYSNS